MPSNNSNRPKKALIVSPNSLTRSTVQKLVQALPEQMEVHTLSTLSEATTFVGSVERVDYTLVDNEFSPEAIADFIDKVTSKHAGKESAFILLSRDKKQESATLASNMMAGLHGFLCEPFSVQAVQEAFKLAKNVRLSSSTARLKVASGLMLFELFEEKEPIQEGEARPNILAQLQRTYDRYKEATGESLSVPVVRNLKSIKPVERIRLYTGVSKRVRRLFEQKFFSAIGKKRVPPR